MDVDPGFTSGSPYIDLQMWAVGGGYVPEPKVAGCWSGVEGQLSGFGNLGVVGS